MDGIIISVDYPRKAGLLDIKGRKDYNDVRKVRNVVGHMNLEEVIVVQVLIFRRLNCSTDV